MTYATQLETNLIDAVTACVMAPIAVIQWLLWLIWNACKAAWPYRQYIALATAIAAAVAVCVAVPMLPVGLGIVTGFAWVTKPRGKVN